MPRCTTAVVTVWLVVAGVAGAEEVPPRHIRWAVAAGVDQILGCQQPGGAFVLSPHRPAWNWDGREDDKDDKDDKEDKEKDRSVLTTDAAPRPSLDQTALAVRALQDALPHLDGERRRRTEKAVRRAIDFISREPPVQYTHAAEDVVCVLLRDDPVKHRRLIRYYAAMLIVSQHADEEHFGKWGSMLLLPSGVRGEASRSSLDTSDPWSTSRAVMGLHYATRAGVSVPSTVWLRASNYYLTKQFQVSGWYPVLPMEAQPPQTISDTLSGLLGTIGLNVCGEMLYPLQHPGCRPQPRSRSIESEVKWMARNWPKIGLGTDTYGVYLVGRLGRIMGRSRIGERDWYQEGARVLTRGQWRSVVGMGPLVACYGVMFLSRGLNPVVINKLERRGTSDWNTTPYDLKHLTEHLEDRHGLTFQWRIVTLEEPVEKLLATPVLQISGHDRLEFTEVEKAKLKTYVTEGGTILGQACCGRKEFDESFRAFVKEVFGGDLEGAAEGHRIREQMRLRGVDRAPAVEVLSLTEQNGRAGVIYLPNGLGRQWHLGGPGAQQACASGAGILSYVVLDAPRLRARTAVAAAPRFVPLIPRDEPPPEPVPEKPQEEEAETPKPPPPFDPDRPIAAETLPEASLEDIQKAIASGVLVLLETQQENGSFKLAERFNVGPYPLGQTALAVLALQHAECYLRGDIASRTVKAIRRGIAFITQNPVEPRTYSAAIIICTLCKENPDAYRGLIAQYAQGLVTGQHYRDECSGQWGYVLKPSTGKGYVDNSNTQFAILGLYSAARAGFEVPKQVWERSRDHYYRSQNVDGGWGYYPPRPQSTLSMTVAGAGGLHICEEMLYMEKPQECKPMPRSRSLDAALKRIACYPPAGGGYGLYALERLGTLMGRSNFGEDDWYRTNASGLCGRGRPGIGRSGTHDGTCFNVLFLAQGLDPIIVNKLERRGTDDWNNTRYDLKHLVEFIQDKHQLPCQWRIVTLEAPLELLLRTPILHISGHEKLDFNPEEKEKLKAYVDGGGTILAQACCSRVEFDASFRELVKELFGGELRALPAGHPIYAWMKIPDDAPRPVIEVFASDDYQGRPGVVYLPRGICRRWHIGGEHGRDALKTGAGMCLYLVMRGGKAHPHEGAETPPVKPETPRTTPGI